MQKLPRLLFVFWSVILLRLKVVSSITVFFVTIVISNFKYIFFRAFRLYFIESYIISNSVGTKIRAFLFVFLFFEIFL